MFASLNKVFSEAVEAAIPSRTLTVSEWADEYRYLSPEVAAEAGRWRTSRIPYAREIMDAISDPRLEMIVIMSAAQVGKTEILHNVIGFYAHLDPSPLMIMFPTLDLARAWSKKRLVRLIEDTPVLKSIFAPAKSRSADNELFYKRFIGGDLLIVGANSPAMLSSHPIRVLLCDEVDRYPSDAGGEGDPLNLAYVRTSTFSNRKVVLASTPTLRGESRIEYAYMQSDQRRFYVPCPHCGGYQVLAWANIKWDDPAEPFYVCELCGERIDESHKAAMIAAGQWRPTAKPQGAIAGFHLSGLCSVWVSWREVVEEFLRAKDDKRKLQVWVNTRLGETWEDIEAGAVTGIESHRESYNAEVPTGVLILTAGVDVQQDRIEYEIVGWGHGEESWSIDYGVVLGDPTRADVWERLRTELLREREHELGVKMSVACTLVDSGGHHTNEVYRFCRAMQGYRVFPAKGASVAGRPVISKPTRAGTSRLKLYMVGTEAAKDTIYSYLRIETEGAGYCHFPNHYPKEYFDQLTSEKRVTKFSHGRKTIRYVKIRDRNEALDCRVLAYAALQILAPNWTHLAESLNERVAEAQQKVNLIQDEEKTILQRERETLAKRQRRFTSSQNFVFGWRR